MNSRNFVKVLMVIIGLSMFSVASAKKNDGDNTAKFPTGCVNTGHRFDLYNVIFAPSGQRSPQTIFFIHNTSNQKIYLLESEEKNKPYILYSNGSVAPNLWSILAVAKKQMKFICTNYDMKTKMHEVVNCQNVLNICEFRQAQFGSNHRGTYWMAINQSKKSAVDMARHYGVWLNSIYHDEE